MIRNDSKLDVFQRLTIKAKQMVDGILGKYQEELLFIMNKSHTGHYGHTDL